VLVLALDTSSAAVSTAIVELSGRTATPRAHERTINPRGHGEYLTPLIARCLRDARATPQDLDAIVAGVGPGPYTGLRVGLVTAAVLSETRGIPAYGVCSLDGIAGALDERRLVVASDARRHEVYWARYQDGERTHGPEVAHPEDVPTDGVMAMAGAGARRYQDVLGLALIDRDFPDPVALVRATADRITASAPADPLTPLYLRRPDAVEPGARKQVTP